MTPAGPVILLLVAFFLQSFVAATHIHGAPLLRDRGVTSLAQRAVPVARPARQLPPDDPADCPFCQAVAHDGAYFMAGVIVLLPVLEGHILPPLLWREQQAAPFRGHDRLQRGPPAI